MASGTYGLNRNPWWMVKENHGIHFPHVFAWQRILIGASVCHILNIFSQHNWSSWEYLLVHVHQDEGDAPLWEQDWDDEDEDADFARQLKEELKKMGK